MWKVVGLLLVAVALAQIPIPNRYDGFPTGDAGSPILFEAFIDLLCPDCKQTWPTMKQLVAYYNPPNSPSDVRFIAHTFPLPYHRNAYYAAQGAHIIADQYNKLTYSYMDLIFDQQASFWNPPTANATSNDVIDAFAQLVHDSLSVPAQTFIDGLNNDSYDESTRISWKYGCSRGVSGTPTFFVNGIPVGGDPTWTLADWRQIIDPLLGRVPPARRPSCSRIHVDVVGDCPKGETLCEYLPGKTECCLAGEMCVKNVGCRC